MSNDRTMEASRRRRATTSAGALVGIGVFVLMLAFIGAVALASKRARASESLATCKLHLRQIAVGLLAYAADNGSALPVSVTVDGPHEELVQRIVPNYLREPTLFYCPSQQAPVVYSAEKFKAGTIGYYYYSASEASGNMRLSKFLRTGVEWPRELTTRMDPKSWMMSDIWVSGDPTAHDAYHKGVNYVMLDGAVDFVTESPRRSFK